jgi:phage antirepressor YoqD-like protein
MDQFTNVLHYLKVHVHYAKPKLSSFSQLIDNDGNIVVEEANKLLKSQAQVVKDWL